jgi:hypothetical protein
LLSAPHVARRRGPENATVSWQVDHAEARDLLDRYLTLLALPRASLRVTTDRREFEEWLGRGVRAAVGGAYTFAPRSQEHLILINLARIDLSRPRSLEVVVAEELIHMRDRLDGDLRRHAKHGHDRIARRVAAITGASLEEIRVAVVPPVRRPARFMYVCPNCEAAVPRQRAGTWSCGRCSPRFDARFVLQLVDAR